jgi:hypothetical protein
MSAPAVEKLPDLDDRDAAWGAMKLPPPETGLPMAVWITPNDGYPDDVRIKVSTLKGGGSWTHDAVQVAVRPRPRELVPRGAGRAFRPAISHWSAVGSSLTASSSSTSTTARSMPSPGKSIRYYGGCNDAGREHHRQKSCSSLLGSVCGLPSLAMI